MSRFGILVGIAAVGLGVAAERVAFGLEAPHQWVPDLVVGWTYVGCGLVAARRRPGDRCGSLMVATGTTWFLGNFAGVQVESVAWLAGHLSYLYRGFLVHLILTYPEGRASSRPVRVAVFAGYLASVVTPVWESETATILLWAALVTLCGREYANAIGGRRRARLQALWAAAGLGLVLAGGAVARLMLVSGTVSRPSLLAFQAMMCLVAGGLLVGVVTADSERVEVTDLVVELGTDRSGTLRAALSKALGDPSLDVGYWFEEAEAFVGSDGGRFALPGPDSERAVTYVTNDGGPVAVIVHDPSVLEDPRIRDAVASATRLAAANSRLQGEVRARVADLEASRRRILDARDDERRRLERRLHDGAEQRLHEVSGALRSSRPSASDTSKRVDRAEEQVRRSLEELGQLAHGIHPRVLSEQGLRRAVQSLVERLPVRVEVTIDADRLPSPVEAAVYFVCAEALANVVKYASASRARVSVIADEANVTVVVEDDGIGGADPARGTGLRGLVDRVATLGGTLQVRSATGRGTRLAAEIPLGGEG